MPVSPGGVFFDTNILLYLASDDDKADRVERLLVAGGTISTQVLNELASVTRRKLRMSWDEIDEFLAPLHRWLTVVPLTVELHMSGLSLARRYALSVYDSFIVAAALHSGCEHLYSEDMQDGLLVERRLRIRNPLG